MIIRLREALTALEGFDPKDDAELLDLDEAPEAGAKLKALIGHLERCADALGNQVDGFRESYALDSRKSQLGHLDDAANAANNAAAKLELARLALEPYDSAIRRVSGVPKAKGEPGCSAGGVALPDPECPPHPIRCRTARPVLPRTAVCPRLPVREGKHDHPSAQHGHQPQGVRGRGPRPARP